MKLAPEFGECVSKIVMFPLLIVLFIRMNLCVCFLLAAFNTLCFSCILTYFAFYCDNVVGGFLLMLYVLCCVCFFCLYGCTFSKGKFSF